MGQALTSDEVFGDTGHNPGSTQQPLQLKLFPNCEDDKLDSQTLHKVVQQINNSKIKFCTTHFSFPRINKAKIAAISIRDQFRNYFRIIKSKHLTPNVFQARFNCIIAFIQPDMLINF